MTNSSKLPIQKLIRVGIIAFVGLIHILLLLLLQFNLKSKEVEYIEDPKIMKLVDFQEYIPPPPPPVVQQKKIQVADQPSSSETVIAVEEKIEIVADLPLESVPYIEPDYLPQHKISKIPVIPSQEILEKIIYPPMALRQNLEAIVYVELYIDSTGLVRKVVVLKDPGHGFAESALKALEGLQCTAAAEANGSAVAVRYRYPIRFVLK